MFAGTFEEHLFLRLSQEDREEILKKHKKIRPFEPMKGRIMKEYVTVPNPLYQNKMIFTPWMTRSIAYVKSLQPKKVK
jgi:TfoX/Sxy family transcriptional regulator of competence genes